MKLNKDQIAKCLLVVVVITAVIFFCFISRHRSHSFDIRHVLGSPREIKHFILSYGGYSALAFLVIYSLKPVLMILPASLFSILAGNIFGPYYGLMLSMAGSFFAATLAFYLANKLGKSFVDKLLKGKALKLDSDIEKYGFKIILLMRLAFVFPHDPLSYAAGLSKMKYKDFILGTVLGIFPEMICFSFLGKSFERPFSFKILFPIISVIIVAVIASYYYKNVKNN